MRTFGDLRVLRQYGRETRLCVHACTAAGVLVAACFAAPKRSAELTGVPPAVLDEEGVRWTAMAR
jgi:hypothetical protein